MPTIYKPRKSPQKDKNNFYDIERRKIYNSDRWRRVRAWKISCNPLCELCLQKNKVIPAEDIHHIISFMSTEDLTERLFLAYDFDNLLSLCKQCHQKIHNEHIESHP